MAKVLLVPGTDDLAPDAWWRPGSEWRRELECHGHQAVNNASPWSTALEGVVGDNDQWETAGEAVGLWLWANQADAMVGFSHGGQVVAYAAAYGPHLKTLFTLGTPVRKDMEAIYAVARSRCDAWYHARSGWRDVWQMLGALFDGAIRWNRDMPHAQNLIAPGNPTHRGLMDPRLWTQQHWWALL